MDFDRLQALLAAIEREGVEYADPANEEITSSDLLGPYPAIQYVPPDGSFHIDILTRVGSAFSFADLETERLPFGELVVTVVTARMPYRMKRDTLRPRDRADVSS